MTSLRHWTCKYLMILGFLFTPQVLIYFVVITVIFLLYWYPPPHRKKKLFDTECQHRLDTDRRSAGIIVLYLQSAGSSVFTLNDRFADPHHPNVYISHPMALRESTNNGATYKGLWFTCSKT